MYEYYDSFFCHKNINFLKWSNLLPTVIVDKLIKAVFKVLSAS